jgi:hypothetical protein
MSSHDAAVFLRTRDANEDNMDQEAMTGALTVAEFCDAYHVGRTFLYQEIKSARLTAVKAGSKTLILKSEAARSFAPKARNGEDGVTRNKRPADAMTVAGGAEGLTFVTASQVAQTPVEWLWPGRIARGKMTLLAGDPGLGKSHIGIDVMARITRGVPWPDGGTAPSGSCLLFTAEDAANDTVCPRLDLAGADMDRMRIAGPVRAEGQRRSFSLATDLAYLGEAIVRIGDVAMMVIDPITAYLGGIDSHRTTDVRSVLEPLDRFAEELQVAILAITHPPKASQSKAIHSFTGSLAFVAAARLAFIAVEEPETERALLLPVKNNLGPKAEGLGYRIQTGTTHRGIPSSHVIWDGVTMTANEAIRSSAETRRGSEQREAEEYRPSDRATLLMR